MAQHCVILYGFVQVIMMKAIELKKSIVTYDMLLRKNYVNMLLFCNPIAKKTENRLYGQSDCNLGENPKDTPCFCKKNSQIFLT